MSLSINEDESSLPILTAIQSTLHAIQQDYKMLAEAVERIDGKVKELLKEEQAPVTNNDDYSSDLRPQRLATSEVLAQTSTTDILSGPLFDRVLPATSNITTFYPPHRAIGSSRIVLTTYPGQSGIDPIPMQWAHSDPMVRGPVVVSRNHSTIRRRNGEYLIIRLYWKLTIFTTSNWRSWGLLFNLPRFGSC